jgi:hypothetical protein
VNPLVRRILVLIVLAALAAGCTSSNNGGGNGTDNGGASPPPQMSTSEARTLLAGAAEMPDRFGMVMALTANGTEMVSVKGAFDNRTGESYFEMKGDPAAFGEDAGEAGAQYLQNGIGIYTTKEGSLYLANGTAFVFPPGDSEGGFVPSPEEGPLSQFTDPVGTFADFDDNTTVHSATPIVHKGKPAMRLVVTTAHEGEDMNATVIVWTSPQRLARIETTLPPEAGDEASPLANALATIDFSYDNDVAVTIPPAAKRALGLAYKSNASPFSGNDGPVVWTFQTGGGIALGDVEVHVKDASVMDGSSESGMDFASIPTKWSMKLSDKTKTEGGVTIAFDDKDGDGKVSANDTLTITSSGNEPPTAVLYDTVTKTYVVPGFGVALLVGALAALALLRRR